MRSRKREFAAFLLNFLWPGLRFYFSGRFHSRKSVSIVGLLITIVTFFAMIPFYSYILSREGILISLFIGMVSGLTGAAVEQSLSST